MLAPLAHWSFTAINLKSFNWDSAAVARYFHLLINFLEELRPAEPEIMLIPL
jgi:hypothetical protein